MAELRSDIKDGAKINIQYLPEVVLSRIADFLDRTKGRLAVALMRGQSEEVVALQSTGGLG